MKSFLTKTDFINTFSCPTRLNYILHPEIYTDSTEENEYLQSLSDGGYQVGKLAQLYYKEGIEITDNLIDAISETSNFMKKDEVVLFEAAIQYKNFYIRVDIIRKNKNEIHLIEVKAKSYNASKFAEDIFYNKDGSVNSEWREYFYDLAFQFYVTKCQYPQAKIKCFFNLPNKNVNSKVNNLFNKFSIKNKKAFFLGTEEDLVDNLIAEVDVTSKIEEIIQTSFQYQSQELLFSEIAEELAEAKVNSKSFKPAFGNHCKACQFTDKDKSKSGMYQCWKQITGFSDSKFLDNKIIDIWNYRSTHKLFDKGKYFIDDLEPEDINVENQPVLGDKPLSNKDRQYLQCFGIETYQNTEGYVSNTQFLKQEMDKWSYPLNFIDFETATPAIPAYKGLAPYEEIAFQYSIHTLDKDGTVVHYSEFIHIDANEFPNFEFIKNLCSDLSKNSGTIFMWSPHERTIINRIANQIIKLGLSKVFKEELNFIEDLLPQGKREMVDLLEISKGGTFYPNSKGSNSIKKVLPAVFRHSKFIQDKYKKPIYGAPNGIKSHNYENVAWIQLDNLGFRDPYDIIKDFSDDAITQGGMAATTFAKLQFEDLSQQERDSLKIALLKYCELDTLAMVMIVESWLNR